MYILQKINMPTEDICPIDDMYFRMKDSDTVQYISSQKKYVFKQKGELLGNTYFNSFSSSKWNQYTEISDIKLLLKIKGVFEISLVKSFLSDGEVVDTVVKSKVLSCEEKKEAIIEYDFSLEQFNGSHFVCLKSLEDGSEFYGGYFFTDKEPANTIKLGAVICTFKREKYVYKNLGILKKEIILNEESPVGKNLEIFVIDNAGTLNKDYFTDKELHLIRNKNVGGAGGFTRGIIEIMAEKSFTHVILMDDDALLDTASIEKTYNFLLYAKKDFEDLYIGGATLRLDKQNIQLESGAVWNNNLLFNIKSNLDLTVEKNILVNELEESRSYNAWVFLCIPLCSISKTNLPLPLFVRGDDMEYGMRNSKKLLAMNGICAWHAPLHNKYSSFMTYYVIRNQLILNALYDSEFNSKSAKQLLFRTILKELLFYRYENVSLVLKAYKDFLRGVPFFLSTDGEQLHKEIMGYAPKMLSFGELSHTQTPFIYAKLNYSKNQNDLNLYTRWIRKMTCNGYFLPSIFYKKGGWNNYGIVELTSCRPINFYRRKKVLQVDLVSNKGYLTQIDKKKALWAWKQYFILAKKMSDKNFKKLVRSYKNDIHKLTNVNFWEKYLNIK